MRMLSSGCCPGLTGWYTRSPVESGDSMPPGNRCTSHQRDNSAITGAEVRDFLAQRVYECGSFAEEVAERSDAGEGGAVRSTLARLAPRVDLSRKRGRGVRLTI